MLNMSNQYYSFIINVILDYFNVSDLDRGDRFYLQLDSQDEINLFIEIIKNDFPVINFNFNYDDYNEFQTSAIVIKNIKLIIAHTSKNIDAGFLVKIRNMVSDQKDEFKNTALLSIVQGDLDSISGGSSNLQKESMPLHPKYIYEVLRNNINESDINKIDQIILKDQMDSLLDMQLIQQISFYDYEDIYTTLCNGGIKNDEYYKFGLFKDPDLAHISGKAQKKRLELNRDLFNKVHEVNMFGEDKEVLEKHFTSKGADELTKDNWKELSFKKVNRFYEEKIAENKKSTVTLKEFLIKNDLFHWDKALNERTKAGQRKRQIIIFNQTKKKEVNIKITFDISGQVNKLEKDFLSTYHSADIELDFKVKNKNIELNIEIEEPDKLNYLRFNYKHDKKASLGAEFYICVFPFEANYLAPVKARYSINPKEQVIEFKMEEESVLFGEIIGAEKHKHEIKAQNSIFTLTDDIHLELFPLPEAYNDNDKLYFTIQLDSTQINFLLKNELPNFTPISGQRIWKLIRETNEKMHWIKENNRLVLGNREYYLGPDYEEYFKWENEFVEEGIQYGEVISGQLLKRNIQLHEDLQEVYSRFITYFKDYSIPSLTPVTKEYKQRAIEYIEEYNKQISQFEEGVSAGKRGTELYKLGTIKANDIIYFTPFHPVIIAYKLKFYEVAEDESINNELLHRLRPDTLIPYIENEKSSREILYRPEHQTSAMEWMIYKPVNKISVSNINQYMDTVVISKIKQYKKHFSYLFLNNTEAPFKISIINIQDDEQILKALLEWMLNIISNESINFLNPVEVTLYRNNNMESAFERFSRLNTLQELKEVFKIKVKINDFYDDTLSLLQSKLKCYNKPLGARLDYSHLTFYKMNAQETKAILPMDDMRTGIAVDGLYSSLSATKDEENYRTGFGTKAYPLNQNNTLIDTAYYVNELAANISNEGSDSYRKGVAIYSRTSTTDDKELKEILIHSHWVTFIDPPVDLEFFNDYKENLVVIHYNDQYSSTTKYDAITVTDKTQQYFAVLKDFLEKKDIDGSNKNIERAIKSFNIFNGEWLLNIIGNKDYRDIEKLSVISAIKYAVSYLDHENILWIPISLEEILRVAGAFGLSKSGGVFTAKNLGVKGRHSDDLLLIGIEVIEGNIELYYYPVEIKIGINSNSVLETGKLQVRKTKKLLDDNLMGEIGSTFSGKFYRNFFVQILISNARKLENSKFWKEKNYKLSDEVIQKLLTDDYIISNKLEEFIGEKGVLSFQNDAHFRSAQLIEEDKTLLLNLPKEDGFKGIIESVNDIRDLLQNKLEDFVKEDMLSYLYDSTLSKETVSKLNEYYARTGEYMTLSERKNIDLGSKGANLEDDESKKHEFIEDDDLFRQKSDEHPKEEPKGKMIEKEDANSNNIEGSYSEKFNIENKRFLLGTAQNSNKKIYWEFGNNELANRHLLISGKSGQGKTYFIQCLLLEQSKQEIPSIVIDYTEGFLPNQLEEEFVDYMGDKLKQNIVYNENLPINPFARNKRDIGGIILPEQDNDIADRVKSVFTSVFTDLGIQQSNAIYDAILEGLKQYGEGMDLEKLRDLLEEADTNYARTALSQIRPLIDRNPFNNISPINWDSIIKSDGEVYIIQLTGFPREVQLVITEFILWDLWNYSVRTGDKNIPIPVIMDEAQNLDHREHSPSARILTEGRKFGWSGWYATQFLKSQLDKDELARLQNSSEKIYFSPPEQELSNIASSLAKEPKERKHWEGRLAGLKKGQCIVHGPILKENGELSNSLVTIVDISPLFDRI